MIDRDVTVSGPFGKFRSLQKEWWNCRSMESGLKTLAFVSQESWLHPGLLEHFSGGCRSEFLASETDSEPRA